jgi:hypothetical protein
MFGRKFDSLSSQMRFISWKLRDSFKNYFWGKGHRKKVFTDIYSGGGWGGESKSGRGSSLKSTTVIREELPPLCEKHDIRTLLDAACGDFYWMRHVASELERYIGVDIVEEMIEANRSRYAAEAVSFMHADITSDPLPKTDAILCRDCFIHLSTHQINRALENFKASGARFLLASSGNIETNYYDIPVGSVRRINLRESPFFFPDPIEVIEENPTVGRQLCLWDLQSLPIKENGG